MASNLMSSGGLILNIVGVVILFFYAPMQPNHYNDGSFGFKDESPNAEEKQVARQKRVKKFKINSRIGLIFIFIGFVLQLISVLLVK